jgi:hypothetical protein
VVVVIVKDFKNRNPWEAHVSWFGVWW